MKKTFLYLLLLVSFGTLQAQQPKKSTKPAKPATEQDEIQKMLKEAQQELDNMSPEERAEMEKMGIKMPKDLTKIVPGGASDANLDKIEKDALAQNQQWKKAAIAALPKKILSDTELKTYLQGYLETIERKISPKAKANALKIYNDYKAKGCTNADLENMALALWIKNGCQEAVWILGKIALTEPQNGNLLNNLAATSTLLGGGHLALPVLQKINRSYPNNSAILNNMGQAWCDLSVIDSSKKYLKLALALDPENSNANYTMSTIAKKEGDTVRAIAFLKKSVKSAYSPKKAGEARQLGSPLTRDDVSGFSPKDDPLGFRSTALPDYAFEVNASGMVRANWSEFQHRCKALAAQHLEQAKKLEPLIKSKNEALNIEIIRTKNPRLYALPFAEKAALYYGKSNEEVLQWVERATEQYQSEDPLKKFKERRAQRSAQFHKEMAEQYPRCPGEGCDHGAWCLVYRAKKHAYENEYLLSVNKWHKQHNEELLSSAVIELNNMVNLYLYISHFPEEVQYANLMAKGSFYKMLSTLEHLEIDPEPQDCGVGAGKKPVYKGNGLPLPRYEDLTCNSGITLALFVVKFKIDCTKASIEGGEGIQFSYEEDLYTGEFEVGLGVGVTAHILPKGGPVTLDARAKLLKIIHFDGDNYLTDHGWKGSVGAEIGVKGTTAEIEGSVKYTAQAGLDFDYATAAGIKLFGGK